MRKNGQHDEVAGSPMHLWRPCHRKLWKLDGAHDQPSSRRAIGYGRPMFGVTSRRNGYPVQVIVYRGGHVVVKQTELAPTASSFPCPPGNTESQRISLHAVPVTVTVQSGQVAVRLNSVCLRLSGGACPSSLILL